MFAIPEEKEHEDISISSEQSHQKDALLDILSPERFRYQLEDFFSLADFPVTFDDLETNTYQLKRELDHKEGNANRIHNTIDDLDDILNIVTTNLQDSFHSTEHYGESLFFFFYLRLPPPFLFCFYCFDDAYTTEVLQLFSKVFFG